MLDAVLPTGKHKIKNIAKSTAEPPFTVKTIDCMQRTGPRKGDSILQYVTFTLDAYQVCHSVGRCASMELLFFRSVSRHIYCWDILLSRQMSDSDAIRCVVDDNFVFQQDSAPVHIALSTV